MSEPMNDALPRLDYYAPESVEAALRLLAEHGPDAKVLAGGQSLLVLLRMGLMIPSVLISLKRIPEMTEMACTPESGLTMGAMVTQHRLETDPLIRERYPALAEAAAAVASPPVRRQGTLGGNLCHADPTGDPPAALIALGAEVELARLSRRRRLPVEDIFADYMETILEPEELLIAVHLPPPALRSGTAYLKHRLRGIDTALVGVGVGLRLGEDGERCVEARIGLVGVGTTPLRAREAEAVLAGKPITDEALAMAGAVAAAESAPLTDTEASEWYRREMVQVFVRRAGTVARERAREAS